ncbi:MAG TPA: methyltransferase [Cytophagales bacterium]|nr:methyltransferase [Cytophagales bacterium]HAA19316.1 methyltransferase [Cytophagales bacterium]HAP61297.1 methyltransferase [Cytophagales bacterium]
MSQAYYHTPESVAEYIQLAMDVNGQELIDQLKPRLSLGAHLLELGSGPGKDWEILSQDYTVTGSDLSLEFLKHLRVVHPKGQFLELDAATLATDQTFDGIYSNKVLHHLTDEDLAKSAVRQAAILNHGGIICHSFWKGDDSETFKGMFVNYHNEAALRGFFGEPFEILTLAPYTEFEEGDSLLLMARKK